jgi:hypothetical protein
MRHDSGYAIPSELRSTNVGTMLGRAGEEESLQDLTISQNYRPGIPVGRLAE